MGYRLLRRSGRSLDDDVRSLFSRRLESEAFRSVFLRHRRAWLGLNSGRRYRQQYERDGKSKTKKSARRRREGRPHKTTFGKKESVRVPKSRTPYTDYLRESYTAPV
ncbi:hypothetical protein NtRootA9_01330 [Arthrobacter sp. NtRootA9]|nr:hypothetical protein NtRootA9_01330 [Arthrobacter sp. NtRootA9]